jgi:hypothetical protein
MMSILNKNFNPRERDVHRVRLGKLVKSQEINKIFTFVVYAKDYAFAGKIQKQIPAVSLTYDTTSTLWSIYYPGKKQIFWSFKELVSAISGSPIHVKK